MRAIRVETVDLFGKREERKKIKREMGIKGALILTCVANCVERVTGTKRNLSNDWLEKEMMMAESYRILVIRIVLVHTGMHDVTHEDSLDVVK